MSAVSDALKSLLSRIQPTGGEAQAAAKHFETIKTRLETVFAEKVKGQIECIFSDAISVKRSFAELGHLSRIIQDMAFDGRARNPLFFDFSYNQLRPDQELRMNEKAKEMADAALANREQWK